MIFLFRKGKKQWARKWKCKWKTIIIAIIRGKKIGYCSHKWRYVGILTSQPHNPRIWTLPENFGNDRMESS